MFPCLQSPIVASLIPGTIDYARKLESIRILSREEIDGQTARMKVEFAPGAGKAPKQQDLLFVKEDSDWKAVFSVWSPSKVPARASQLLPRFKTGAGRWNRIRLPVLDIKAPTRTV